MHEINPSTKQVPDDGINKVGQEKMKNMFTCPKCNYEAEWLDGTKRLNAGLARERRMARNWDVLEFKGCIGEMTDYHLVSLP
jgi:hypothetical protein